MTDALRESKWHHVQSTRARFEQVRRRHPRLARALARLARAGIEAYSRLEMPRSVGLAEGALAALEDAWPDHGIVECRALWHGYRLRLDLSDYFQRLAWVLRRWPDVPTQVLLWHALAKGDTLIDGGANIGAMSLMGAWRVGPAGHVHAFEPVSRSLEALRWHVKTNSLAQVKIHPCGLSDRADTLALFLPREGNSGAATFAPLPDRYLQSGSDSAVARTVRGDDAGIHIAGELVVKLDIEGFEVRALRGLAALLDRHRPLVITEVNPEMLVQAGTSSDELATLLMGRGYTPYAYTTRPRRRLILNRVDPAALPVEVAWLRPESVIAGRLTPWIA